MTNIEHSMTIGDEEKPAGVKPKIDPKTNKFLFKRTAAGEKVRTLVEMKGDEVIREGVDAAYRYLNGKRNGLTGMPLSSSLNTGLQYIIFPLAAAGAIGVAVFILKLLYPALF